MHGFFNFELETCWSRVEDFKTIFWTKGATIKLSWCSPHLKSRVIWDPILAGLRSRVIYKFSCAGCSACYIGETSRHFATRIREHLASDKNSHIFKHLRGSVNCGSLCKLAWKWVWKSSRKQHCWGQKRYLEKYCPCKKKEERDLGQGHSEQKSRKGAPFCLFVFPWGGGAWNLA